MTTPAHARPPAGTWAHPNSGLSLGPNQIGVAVAGASATKCRSSYEKVAGTAWELGAISSDKS